MSESRDTSSSSRPGSPATVKSEEEINVEYLRNVILQFLEHQEMRVRMPLCLLNILCALLMVHIVLLLSPISYASCRPYYVSLLRKQGG